MALKLTEIRTDHEGHPLPPGVYAVAREDGSIVGYKVRWREEDENGVRRNAAKRFSARKLGSLDRARKEARAYRGGAIGIVRRGEVVLRSEAAARMTVDDLFKEWLSEHGVRQGKSAGRGAPAQAVRGPPRPQQAAQRRKRARRASVSLGQR